MNNEHKKSQVFGARPLMPVGTGPDLGTQCLQLTIPAGELAVRHLFGALQLMTKWANFERDPSHYGIEWAKAWLAAIQANFPMRGCDMAIEFMQDDCGLYYREIGAETWTQIYDGLYCLESDGARSFFDGIIGDYIDQLIADGTLLKNSGQPGPTPAPEPGVCKTYHVVLQGNSQWILPSMLGYEDSIICSALTGAWTDGTPAWFCTDGSSFGLGICGPGGQGHDDGDVLNPGAYHMALVMKVDTTWYAAPVGTSFVQESGTTPLQVIFQANDGSLSDNAGEIQFDVTVCTGQWHYSVDFTTGLHDWILGQNTYQDANGVHTAIWNGYVWLNTGFILPNNGRVTRVRIVGHYEPGNYNGDDVLRIMSDGATVYVYKHGPDIAADFDITADTDVIMNNNVNVQFVPSYNGGTTGFGVIETVEFWGSYPNPFE